MTTALDPGAEAAVIKAEALLEAAGAQRAADPGHGTGWLLDLVQPGQAPFDALVAAWLSTFGSTNTVAAYRSDVTCWRRYLATLSPPPDPLLVDVAHAAGFADWLERRGGSERTQRRRITALSSCYTFAVARKIRRDNPFAAVRRPPKSHRVRGPRLTRDQAMALLAAIGASTKEHHHRDQVIAGLLARCDLGIGAICAANLGDLQLAPFPQLCVAGRAVALPLDVLDAVRAYLPRRVDPLPPPPGEEEDELGYNPRDPLFYLQSPRRQGQRISHGSRITRDAVATRLRVYAEHVPAIGDQLQDTLSPHDLLGVLRATDDHRVAG
jgi:integrase